MVISPLIERELKRALRQRWHPRIRTGTTIAVCLVALCSLWSLPVQAVQNEGRTLFFLISSVLMGLAALSGLCLTSLSLREEKATRMLDLLLITDVRSTGVLTAKLVTYGNAPLQILLGAMPVLATVMVLGGVSLGEFARMSVLILMTLCLSSVVGLFAAAWAKTGHSAVILTGTIIACLSIGSYIAESLSQSVLGPEAATLSLYPGLFQAFGGIADLRHAIHPESYWANLQCYAVLTVGLFALAARQLPRLYFDQSPQSRPGLALNHRLTAHAHPKVSSAPRHRNPAQRLADIRRWHPLFISSLLGGTALALLAILTLLHWPATPRENLWLIVIPLALHTILKLGIAAKVSGFIADCRKNGELEILLTTPISAARLNRGLWKGLLNQFKFPIAVLLAIDVLILLLGDAYAGYDGSNLTLWLIVWGLIVTQGIDTWALLWIGLWEGLHARNALHAFRKTLKKVYLYPITVFLVSFLLSPIRWFTPQTIASNEQIFADILWWWGVSFCLISVLTFRAKHLLSDEFRTAAAAPTHAPRPRRPLRPALATLPQRFLRAQPGEIANASILPEHSR